ncbi:DUF4232 domain-containing protein [Streptomyces sp. FXJ1.172]|uniref:DUF4232 domain-containing protein n=1 Tax=Streptomyces sp. FXJ1.172 TaxID=710705 RepID=UPI0007D036BE|nr:DUF4232 domain-containing protein [Streptomyces sp. FXJ1.172]WEO93812.1 DUF4232 domain-containing protein [Streptomyces sp. FXJ1.172]
MVYAPRSARHGALLVGSFAVLGLLTACGSSSHDVHSSPPLTSSGTAAPATGGTQSPVSATSVPSAATTGPGAAASSAPRATTSAGGAATTSAASGSRCHTSELRASVGRNDPGAGQENFPVVLTNASARTCTLHGYPGAAFVNASGTQLGPDPKRESGSPVTITLKPGQSAWAGLTFSNPGVSGAKTATPAALVVTPPDERDSLKVAWAGGAVPVGGNSSSVFLSVFAPGTAP